MRVIRLPKILHLGCVLFAGFLLSSVLWTAYAQDGQPPSGAESADEQDQTDPPAQKAPPPPKPEAKRDAGKSKPDEEVFKPTEEISEDLPVPFPVDI